MKFAYALKDVAGRLTFLAASLSVLRCPEQPPCPYLTEGGTLVCLQRLNLALQGVTPALHDEEAA